MTRRVHRGILGGAVQTREVTSRSSNEGSGNSEFCDCFRGHVGSPNGVVLLGDMIRSNPSAASTRKLGERMGSTKTRGWGAEANQSECDIFTLCLVFSGTLPGLSGFAPHVVQLQPRGHRVGVDHGRTGRPGASAGKWRSTSMDWMWRNDPTGFMASLCRSRTYSTR